jgi:hypothetical protein
MPLGADTGSIRESFFYSQLSVSHDITLAKNTDFAISVDNSVIFFEIGGASKTPRQLQSLSTAYVVKDNIENGSENIIPLWLFGFLY